MGHEFWQYGRGAPRPHRLGVLIAGLALALGLAAPGFAQSPLPPSSGATPAEASQSETSNPGTAPVRVVPEGASVPTFFDPAQRETPLDVSAVPAIRFLTSADFPPFNYRDKQGDLTGFNVDLAQAICATLELSCTIQDWPFEQLSEALKLGQGDAVIAGLSIDAKAGKTFDFSNIYLEFPARFVVRADGAKGFSPSELAGKKIAVRKGSAHERFARDFFGNAQLVGYDTEALALDALSSGAADVFFGDGMRAAFWLNAHPNCCGFAGPPILRADYFDQGLAIAVPAGRDALRVALDHALARLQKSGKYEELFLRWFPVGFY